ncbi:uncharacterized protein LOC130293198 [Hyla sarda]|uniref:uncharacterized protein LOC130293198 n=1 Tax=Hyla sarda TaxID=327740 RepID=UPI0024C35C27|nr:uncharacterized protein LOC130293198 [Hyla sarda]
MSRGMGIKKAEKRSAGGKRKKIPYEDQLQFLRPNRVLRPTSGNFQAPSNTQQDADEEPRSEPVRSDTPLESEAPGPSNPLEYFDQHLDVKEDVSNLSSDLPPSSTPTSAADEIEEMEEAKNIPSSQTSTRPPTARRTRRSLQITDSQLEVESQALSFIRRVDSSDDSYYFGYEMASCCRKVPLDRQNHFKAYCHAVPPLEALSPLEDMIKNLHITAGHRAPSPPPPAYNISTQTEGFYVGTYNPLPSQSSSVVYPYYPPFERQYPSSVISHHNPSASSALESFSSEPTYFSHEHH